ncbi:hypothetical protein EV424DRAFT_1541299 [Suillus variegatus]|nr:hypothetical protein EV424DRAFT_1541299 [Suillus variegatus]
MRRHLPALAKPFTSHQYRTPQTAFKYPSTSFRSTTFSDQFLNLPKPSTIVILPKWKIDAFFECVPKYHIAVVSLAPLLVHQLVHRSPFKTANLSLIKGIGCGAAHLPPQLADQLRACLPAMNRVSEGYGLSEFSSHLPNTIRLPMSSPEVGNDGRHETCSWHAQRTRQEQPGSVGTLVPGVEAHIVRPDGSLTNQNEAGAVHVRDLTAALGCKGDDNATREMFVHGWVLTGDQLQIDDMIEGAAIL